MLTPSAALQADVAFVAAVLAVLASVAFVIRWGRRLAKRQIAIAEAVLGDPKDDDKPSLREWQKSTDERLASMESEFHPNGGTSSRDSLDWIVESLHALAKSNDVRLRNPPPRRPRRY